jgi:hypothetical protein
LRFGIFSVPISKVAFTLAQITAFLAAKNASDTNEQ